MKKEGICFKCGNVSKLTEHHIYGGGKGDSIMICRLCHDIEHDICIKAGINIKSEIEYPKFLKLSLLGELKLKLKIWLGLVKVHIFYAKEDFKKEK